MLPNSGLGCVLACAAPKRPPEAPAGGGPAGVVEMFPKRDEGALPVGVEELLAPKRLGVCDGVCPSLAVGLLGVARLKVGVVVEAGVFCASGFAPKLNAGAVDPPPPNNGLVVFWACEPNVEVPPAPPNSEDVPADPKGLAIVLPLLLAVAVPNKPPDGAAVLGWPNEANGEGLGASLDLLFASDILRSLVYKVWKSDAPLRPLTSSSISLPKRGHGDYQSVSTRNNDCRLFPPDPLAQQIENANADV